MGGRGSSSGGRNGGYSKDGTIKLSGEKKHVERLTGMNRYGGDNSIVLSASTDGRGNITLNYASPVSYREQNSKSTYAQYELTAGLSNRSATGKTTDIESHGINWDKVKSVSGKTYGTQTFMRSKGFSWNKEKKIWEK